MAGLGSLVTRDYATAQASFNAVYGQVPGELAPKLALAMACELGGEPDLAESLYRVCASTDANYVTPAAFGLARVLNARGDVPGSLAALELVPSTSRGYPEAQRARVAQLVHLATDATLIDRALAAMETARLDPGLTADYRQTLYERAVIAAQRGPVRLGGTELSAAQLRVSLESIYRERAGLATDPATKADLVDKANSIRAWSLL